MTNRKLFVTVGFVILTLALATAALLLGKVGAGVWLAVVNTDAMLTASYLGLNVAQKGVLAKLGPPAPGGEP